MVLSVWQHAGRLKCKCHMTCSTMLSAIMRFRLPTQVDRYSVSGCEVHKKAEPLSKNARMAILSMCVCVCGCLRRIVANLPHRFFPPSLSKLIVLHLYNRFRAFACLGGFICFCSMLDTLRVTSISRGYVTSVWYNSSVISHYVVILLDLGLPHKTITKCNVSQTCPIDPLFYPTICLWDSNNRNTGSFEQICTQKHSSCGIENDEQRDNNNTKTSI